MKALRAARVISWTTTLEAVRNKLLLTGLLFAVVLIGLSMSAAAISIGERARLIIDVGLASASAISSVMTVALMVTSFAGELSKHTAFPVLARPIPRWAFILGKYLGVVVAMWAVVSIMVLATALTVKAYGHDIPSALWWQWPLALVEVCLVAGIALMFSTLAVPALAAAYTAGLVLAGNLATQIHDLVQTRVRNGDQGGFALEALYYALPDLESLSVRIKAANDLAVSGAYVVSGVAYAVCYAACVILIGMLVFNRRKAI